MAGGKEEIITFKADKAFVYALRGIENRSQFIRAAVLQALDSACPLCQGTGMLRPQQKQHWEEFTRSHKLAECEKCHEMRIICHEMQQTDDNNRCDR